MCIFSFLYYDWKYLRLLEIVIGEYHTKYARYFECIWLIFGSTHLRVISEELVGKLNMRDTTNI